MEAILDLSTFLSALFVLLLTFALLALAVLLHALRDSFALFQIWSTLQLVRLVNIILYFFRWITI
jgi:hypothetical protein